MREDKKRERIMQKHCPKEKFRKLMTSLAIIEALHTKHLFLPRQSHMQNTVLSQALRGPFLSTGSVISAHLGCQSPLFRARALLSCELTSLSCPFSGTAPSLAGLRGRSLWYQEGQREKSSGPLSNSGLEIPFVSLFLVLGVLENNE